MNCPECGEIGAYQGLAVIECRNPSCTRYTEAQAKSCPVCGGLPTCPGFERDYSGYRHVNTVEPPPVPLAIQDAGANWDSITFRAYYVATQSPFTAKLHIDAGQVWAMDTWNGATVSLPWKVHPDDLHLYEKAVRGSGALRATHCEEKCIS